MAPSYSVLGVVTRSLQTLTKDGGGLIYVCPTLNVGHGPFRMLVFIFFTRVKSRRRRGRRDTYSSEMTEIRIKYWN